MKNILISLLLIGTLTSQAGWVNWLTQKQESAWLNWKTIGIGAIGALSLGSFSYIFKSTAIYKKMRDYAQTKINNQGINTLIHLRDGLKLKTEQKTTLKKLATEAQEKKLTKEAVQAEKILLDQISEANGKVADRQIYSEIQHKSGAHYLLAQRTYEGIAGVPQHPSLSYYHYNVANCITGKEKKVAFALTQIYETTRTITPIQTSTDNIS